MSCAFPDIAKDCPEMRNVAKTFIRSFENVNPDDYSLWWKLQWLSWSQHWWHLIRLRGSDVVVFSLCCSHSLFGVRFLSLLLRQLYTTGSRKRHDLCRSSRLSQLSDELLLSLVWFCQVFFGFCYFWFLKSPLYSGHSLLSFVHFSVELVMCCIVLLCWLISTLRANSVSYVHAS